MLRLLGRATSGNVQKVLWLLDEMALPYEQENIGGPFGKNKEPEYLALNPNGLVPTLVDGDLVLWESNAILRYIAGQYSGEQYYPVEPRRRAIVDQWLDWQASTLVPAMIPLFMGVMFEKRSPHDLPDAVKAAEAKFTILDGALAGRNFLAGDKMSLAEFAFGCFVYRWFHMDAGTAPLPNLRRWYDQMAARPAFQKAIMVGMPNFTPKPR